LSAAFLTARQGRESFWPPQKLARHDLHWELPSP